MNVIQMVQIADILGFMRSSLSCGRPLNSLEMIENITKNNQQNHTGPMQCACDGKAKLS